MNKGQVRMEIINPMASDHWDQRILAADKASFFHSAAWAATLAETYGYTPCYFVLASKNDEIKALVPLMEIRSFITGKRGVSLPFSDYCEPFWDTPDDGALLLDAMLDHGKKNGWKYLELRSGTEVSTNQSPSDTFLGHTLDLSPAPDDLFSSFRGSTRRNIKKALAADIDCKASTSPRAIRQFYELNCLTRKRHGIPPQPYSFFKNIYKHIISRNKGLVFLASYKNKVIAGAVYFHFGREAIYKYGASNSDYQHLRANYLVMWQAIRHYRMENYISLDLGRTDTENKGLHQYKCGWNPRIRELSYYRYPLGKPCAARKEKTATALEENIMRHLPVPLLKMIGSFAYRHVG